MLRICSPVVLVFFCFVFFCFFKVSWVHTNSQNFEKRSTPDLDVQLPPDLQRMVQLVEGSHFHSQCLQPQSRQKKSSPMLP